MHDGQKPSGDRLLHPMILLNRDSSFEKSQASKHIEGETFEILMIVFFFLKEKEKEKKKRFNHFLAGSNSLVSKQQDALCRTNICRCQEK